MKKIICILTICVLLFCGCEQGVVPSQTEPPATEYPIYRPTLPADPGNDLAEYDPAREFFVTLGDFYIDLYLDTSFRPYINFEIISKKPMDLSDAKVCLPIESSYTVHIDKEAHVCRQTAYTAGDNAPNDGDIYTIELFKAYCGKDWSITESVDELNAMHYSYQRLTVDDLPEFYVYDFRVQFNSVSKQDESFSYLDITIGGETFRQEVGLVRLYPTTPTRYTLEWSIESLASFATQGGNGFRAAVFPYNDGLFRVDKIFTFIAPFDMTIDSLDLLCQSETLVRAEVEYGGMSFQWDGTEPFAVSKNDKVTISVIIGSEHLAKLCYQSKIAFALNYTYPNGTATKLTDCTLMTASTMSHNEVYAIVFDGLDLESYYKLIYYPVRDAWRKDFQ